MEYPTFSLPKNRGTCIRVYSRVGRSIRVIPSVVGVATVFNKDVLIYCIDQIMRGHDAGIKVSRRVRVDVYPFPLEACRSTGDAAYERMMNMCRRLKGTTVETNVKTNEKEQLESFGLTEDYRVTTWMKNGKDALKPELIISEWPCRAAMNFDILTLHPNYSSLGQALERHSYELARKHCDDKAWREIGLLLLLEKMGNSQTLRYPKQETREIVKCDLLPDYQMFLGESVRPNRPVIMAHDNAKLVCGVDKVGKLSWVSYFLQKKLA